MLARRACRAQRGRSAASRSSPGSRPRSRRAARWSPTISPTPGLQEDLDKLGFNLVGYGCTTCIGNSGPLPEPIAEAIDEGDLVGRRGALRQPQFRGPHPSAGARQLPRLAAAGRRLCAGRLGEASISPTDPLGEGSDGKPVYLRDIWPSQPGDRRHGRAARCSATMFQQALRQCLRGPGGMARRSTAAERHDLRLGSGLDLSRPTRPISRTCRRSRGRCRDVERRARAGDSRRQHHHRPHLARRLDQEGQPGRRVS